MLKAFTTFLDYINSFPLSQARIGTFVSARYTGFDSISTRVGTGDIPISLNHSSIRGVTEENEFTNYIGSVLTPHGVVVVSDESIPLVVSFNNTTEVRYDAIYLEYSWISEEGGNTPTVSILQDVTPGTQFLSNPRTQVLLGIITILPGSLNFSSLSYTPQSVPLLGGANFLDNYPELDLRWARLQEPNLFRGTQSWAMKDINLAMGDYLVTREANYYKIIGNGATLQVNSLMGDESQDFQPGTIITLTFENIGSKSFLATGLDSYHGFRLGATIVGGIPSEGILAFPINNGDVVELIYRGTYNSIRCWDIISAPTYVANLLASHEASIQALLNPSNTAWVPVLESGQYAYESGIVPLAAPHQFSYRLNRIGQLEFKGRFSLSVALPQASKICTINPNYVPHNFGLIWLNKFYGTDNNLSIAPVPASVNSLGGITLLGAAGAGNYACTSVVSSV